MRSSEFLTRDNINSKLDEWLSVISKHSYRRPELVLKPSKCSLIVVDMLNYFASPDGRAYLPSTAAIIPRIARLIHFWRKGGHSVVFTRHCHHGPHDLGMLGKFFGDYIRCDEWDSEIVEELSPLESERVFKKNTYDAFYGTGLEEYLTGLKIEQVLITGVLTQMCCETTARSAFVRGFEVYVPADGLTTSSENLHIGSLTGLSTSVAGITTVEEICGSSLD